MARTSYFKFVSKLKSSVGIFMTFLHFSNLSCSNYLIKLFSSPFYLICLFVFMLPKNFYTFKMLIYVFFAWLTLPIFIRFHPQLKFFIEIRRFECSKHILKKDST